MVLGRRAFLAVLASEVSHAIGAMDKATVSRQALRRAIWIRCSTEDRNVASIGGGEQALGIPCCHFNILVAAKGCRNSKDVEAW